MKLLCNIYLYFAFIIVTALVVGFAPLWVTLGRIFRGWKTSVAIRRGIRLYGWFLVCKVPFLAPVKVIYSGDKLPPLSIFVANHNSAIDPYLFGAIPMESGFVTSWPFRIPLYNIFMKLAGYADSELGWDNVLDKSRRMLEEGCVVSIWPEGHRARNGKMGRFRTGAFTLSAQTGAPITPICIIGSKDVLPPGKRIFNPGQITLVVLEPIYPPVGASRDEIRDMAKLAHTRIKETLQSYGHFNE